MKLEKICVMLDENAVMPTRAHDEDAGLDLYAKLGDSKIIYGKGSAVFDTGVHVLIPKGYAGLLVSKSGLNVKNGITSTGLIDSGYVGSICVKLDNHSDRSFFVYGGQKISQLVLIPVETPQLVVVDELPETERGSGGFGSTGAV